jgi:hypothetical protein
VVVQRAIRREARAASAVVSEDPPKSVREGAVGQRPTAFRPRGASVLLGGAVLPDQQHRYAAKSVARDRAAPRPQHPPSAARPRPARLPAAEPDAARPARRRWE